MIYEFKVDPIGKPRMTISDKWKKRDCVQRYWAFKDSIKRQAAKNGYKLMPSGDHIGFIIPMPKSWSLKKKAHMDGSPHTQKPDIDNLEKALFDSLLDDDAVIWNISASKHWGSVGKILISRADLEREGI